KNGNGAVTPGAGTGDCTLELTDADFMAMTSGKADAMKLYMGGMLKIGGDVMASQKLSFLQKIDPKEALEAITKKRGGASAAPAPSAAASAPPAAIDRESFGSADVFTAIEDHVARNPDLVSKVGKVFVFKLTSPDSAWTIDVKNGKGSVVAGVNPADTTLELTDADFLAMTSGKADAMKLYMGGKLKIGGDVMASQKLSFLQKIDPKHAQEAVMKKRGGGTTAGAGASADAGAGAKAHKPLGGIVAPATTPASGGSAAVTPALFKALGERLAKNPGLAKEVGALLQVNVTNPSASWVVDLTGPGEVREGTDAKATTTLRIDDADLAALSKDPSTARDLYQHGKLKVIGDVRVAQKLGFLKDLV
ncbi:MAG TPA: SCP2 sterol-binding domain-containing protein, partial [Polyangiaceae bacterium]|nr:SCP2 sterol-binding domain-containing protein [Polyangiaceae bacterium]